MRPLVRPSYAGVPPWLERGGRGDRCCPPAVTFCIRTLHSPGKKKSSILSATGKPPSQGVSNEEDDSNAETANGDAPPPEEIPVTNNRARKSVWQRFNLGLPVVGSGLGFQNEGMLASADNGDMDIEWGDIVDPTPENLLALLLTGLLGLAVLQIFWQLLLVAITITLAALKYSVIAAILLTLLIVFL